MNMRKTIFFILLVISGLSFLALWIVSEISFADNRLLILYYQNQSQKRQPISSGTVTNNSHFNTNSTKHEIFKKFPVSLWHSANNDYSHKNDRIDSQRQLMEYLSELDERIPVKNILVFMKRTDTYYKESEKQKLCPNENKMRDKCKFVRANLSDMFSYISKLSEFDAVVSAVHSIEKDEIKLWKLASLAPQLPPPHVYFTLESHMSPFVPSVNLSLNNKIVASYWSNADISLPYGKWVKNNQLITSNTTQKNYAEGKTKLVAMLVSNCGDKNGRLKYAKELNEHIQVDIYGKCSPQRYFCGDFKECFQILKNEYKFYLAFENANCREYITEKLFRNAFKNDIVPIVMGAHPDDYKAIAPHHSYISVEDFKSPNKLADYLLKLNSSDQLYNEYFKWKGTGYFMNTISDFFCRVCAMIIYSDFQPKPAWPLNSTLKTENYCLTRNVWYWTH